MFCVKSKTLLIYSCEIKNLKTVIQEINTRIGNFDVNRYTIYKKNEVNESH